MTEHSLRGAMTALVTPFSNGQVDWARLDRLVDWQIEGGIDWIVACGTTGESAALTDQEHDRLLQSVIDRAAHRCPVMAGTGSNNTAQTIERTMHAEHAGADAALIVTPYYVRPTQEGLFRHYAAIAEAVTLPLVLYNVPVRTGVDLSVETTIRLREQYPHIVAVKDATGRVDAASALLSRSNILVLCGDDSLTWPMMALGAVGVISVIGNLRPGLMKALVASAAVGDYDKALGHHREVADLANALARFGPNPIPIKTAMALCGMIEDEFRLPLCSLGNQERMGLRRLLETRNLLTASAA